MRLRDSSGGKPSFPSSGTPGEGQGGGAWRAANSLAQPPPHPSPGVPREGEKGPSKGLHPRSMGINRRLGLLLVVVLAPIAVAETGNAPAPPPAARTVDASDEYFG